MRIILLGPPGSGKGTQGDLIEREYNFPRIAAGDLLRQAIKERTETGKKVEVIMNRGELVSDEIVIEMIKERILKKDCKRGYILDGFPRNISQAQKLEQIDRDRSEVVLDIQLRDRLLVERLASRRICSDCGTLYNLKIKMPAKDSLCDICSGYLVQREDDTSEAIKRRLRVYHEQTKALIGYYQKKNVYCEINGERGISEIFSDIREVLDNKMAAFHEARS